MVYHFKRVYYLYGITIVRTHTRVKKVYYIRLFPESWQKTKETEKRTQKQMTARNASESLKIFSADNY